MELLDLSSDCLRHILAFLDPQSEFALSKTCTLFKEMCQSGWHSLTINLGQKTSATDDEMEILKISGSSMQNIHISVDLSEVKQLDRLSVFRKPTQCNMKKFSFDIVNIPEAQRPRHPRFYSDSARIRDYESQFATPLTMILSKCFSFSIKAKGAGNSGLEALSLSAHSWKDEVCYYRLCLPDLLSDENFYFKRLKSLALDCFFSHRGHYFTSRSLGMLGINREYRQLIRRFENLTQLDINSFYLTDSLIKALSKPGRANLQSMTIVLDLCECQPITSWPLLVNSSPSLEVTVEAFFDINYTFVRQAFPACVPIVSWKIYSLPGEAPFSCNILEMKTIKFFSLLCVYKQTLQSIAVQSSSVQLCHSSLLEMVTQCSKLHTLYLQGRIHCYAILKMASLQRQWLKLGVLKKCIIFPRSWKESRQKNIERLRYEVSEKLGYEWKPELEATYVTIFSRPVLN